MTNLFYNLVDLITRWIIGAPTEEATNIIDRVRGYVITHSDAYVNTYSNVTTILNVAVAVVLIVAAVWVLQGIIGLFVNDNDTKKVEA